MRGRQIMIFAIKPFEIHDGDGIRTTVFFKGCHLRCKWCHNPESLSFEKEILFDKELCRNCMKCTSLCTANYIINEEHMFTRQDCTLCGKCEDTCPNNAFEIAGKNLSAKDIAQEVLRDEIFMKRSGGGVTFSGGEPLLQFDFCTELAKILKEHEINIAIDTSGYVKRENIDKMIPYTDTFLFDIKAIDEDVHINCTGVSNKLILGNIKYVDSLGIPMEIRYPFVPSMNDNQAEKVTEFVNTLKSVKAIKILPYHNYAERKYTCLNMRYSLTEIPIPTKSEIAVTLEKMRKISNYTISVG